MLPATRSLPLLLVLLLAVLAAVLAPGASPLAGALVAAGLLHRIAVVRHHRHRTAVVPVIAPAVAVAPAAP